VKSLRAAASSAVRPHPAPALLRRPRRRPFRPLSPTTPPTESSCRSRAAMAPVVNVASRGSGRPDTAQRTRPQTPPVWRWLGPPSYATRRPINKPGSPRRPG